MIFHWAPADLSTYWKTITIPAFTKSTISWMVRQCQGVVEGLAAMHNYRNATSYQKYNVGDSDKTDVNLETDKFGRHGDIKPQNILWFSNNTKNANGKLVLIDFEHSVLLTSKYKSNALALIGDRTYRPPNVQDTPEHRFTQRDDIWSLGCVYLEFITWLIMGYEGIKMFQRYREERTSSRNIALDQAFYTRNVGGGLDIVREAVTFWIFDLRQKLRCSRMLDEFLTLIQERMLFAKQSERASAEDIAQSLSSLYQKSLGDESFVLGRPTKQEYFTHQLFYVPDNSEERANSRISNDLSQESERRFTIVQFIDMDKKFRAKMVSIEKGVDLPLDGKVFEQLEPKALQSVEEIEKYHMMKTLEEHEQFQNEWKLLERSDFERQEKDN